MPGIVDGRDRAVVDALGAAAQVAADDPGRQRGARGDQQAYADARGEVGTRVVGDDAAETVRDHDQVVVAVGDGTADRVRHDLLHRGAHAVVLEVVGHVAQELLDEELRGTGLLGEELQRLADDAGLEQIGHDPLF